MTYSDKVKQSKGLLEAIKALGDGEKIIVSYGTDYNGQPREFEIKCSVSETTGTHYRINKNEVWSMSGMNISSLNRTTMDAYTFDMMSQRTTYRFPLYKMKIV